MCNKRTAFPIGNAVLFDYALADCLLQCLRQLIGAGGGLAATGGAFQAGDNLCSIHTFYQRADTLQVAIATTDELHIFNLAILNIKENALGASAKSLVFKHGVDPFRIFCAIIL